MEMSKMPKLRVRAGICYLIVAVLFTLFFVYMLACARTQVYRAREDRGYENVQHYTESLQPDDQAPAGVNRVFRWTLESHCRGDSITFYVVHHYVKVYLDGELVYSLQPSASNRIGRTTSSNWVSVPIYPEDVGKEVTVVATPVYKDVINRQIDFYVGSRFDIFSDCLMQDVDVLVISTICILVGLFIMSMQVYQLVKRDSPSLEMFYLGNFSVILGIWRLTDTRVIAFLLPKYAMAMGYITIGALVLCAIPLLLFLKGQLAEFDGAPLLHAAMALSGAALAILLLQVLGIADFREMLPVCHIMLAGTAAMLLAIVVVHWIQNGGHEAGRSTVLMMILVVGAVMDIVSYYWRNTSDNVVFTALAFVIDIICLFTINTYETKNKAYTDPNTGLFNKNRWDELMNSRLPVTGNLGVIMLDLNALKYVNDTYGHDAGDRMIFDFANILRNTLPPGTVICRWGGDEFTAMLMDSSAEAMQQYLGQLDQAVQHYNDSGKPPFIYFSAGYALASEFPELSREELLSRADERMYQEKRQWYTKHRRIR